jgi:hypothetical protein
MLMEHSRRLHASRSRFDWRFAWVLSMAACTALEDSTAADEAGVAAAPDAADGPGYDAASTPWGTPPDVFTGGVDAGSEAISGITPTSTGGGSPTQPTGNVPNSGGLLDGGGSPTGSLTPGAQLDATVPPASCTTPGSCGMDSGSASTPSTATCAADLACTPLAACRSGKTSCTGSTSSCVESGNLADGASCSGGACSNGHCCPSGQQWNGSACAVVCASSQRLCNGSTCIAPETPCSNACPSGRVLCNGICVVGNCCSNAQCGRCKKCSSNQCQNQTTSEDLNNECYEGPCDTGFCNGAGDCAHLPTGTVYCEVTRLITCGAGGTLTDMQCENWCLPSCKPTDSSCRGPATCNECHPGLGLTKCASNSSISECGSNGRWLPGVACPSGQVCRGDNITASCTSP